MAIVTDSPRCFKAILAAHIDDNGIVREVEAAERVHLRCVFLIGYPADESVVDRTLAEYQAGTLLVNVRDYEKAEILTADLVREAKRNAAPKTWEEAAAVEVARERERNRQIAAQTSPGIASRNAHRLAAETAEMNARVAAAQRAQRVGPRPPDNLGIPQEELLQQYRRHHNDDGDGR